MDPRSGALAELSGSPYDGGYFPVAASVIRDGRLVAVCNEGDSGHYAIPESVASLSVYARNPLTGVLTAVPGSPFGVSCLLERWLALAPSGRTLFTAGAANGRILGFRLDEAGQPHAGGQARYGGPGLALDALRYDPGERFLFALLDSPPAIVVYAVDDQVRIEERQRAELGRPGWALDVDPGGRSLFDQRDRQLHAWVLDRARGVLRPADRSPLEESGGALG